MSWLLLHNPVADLPGPQFLGLFWAVTIVLIAAAARGVRRLDPSLELEPLPTGFKFDAHELACLRGGAQALLHTTLFDLWRRGFLEIVEAKKGEQQMVQADNGSDPTMLDTYEREILDEFVTPRNLTKLPSEAKLVFLSKDRARALESILHDELLLMPDEVRAHARSVAWLAATSLLLLAGYKLGVALVKEHYNVIFLIVSIVAAMFLVLIATRLRRQTGRGSDYLERLRLTFAGWPDRLREQPADLMSPNTVMAVALLGYPVLAGTVPAAAWLSIGTAFNTMGNSSGGGGGGCGGGGCGGGGCGGGGCGGGCGGCGG